MNNMYDYEVEEIETDEINSNESVSTTKTPPKNQDVHAVIIRFGKRIIRGSEITMTIQL